MPDSEVVVGDLISRAAALNAIDCWHIDFNPMDGAKVQTDCWRTIKELPAVDAVPAVHGRWTYFNCVGNGRYQCSECLHWVDAGTDRNYCPNCGARMDGDTE